MRAGVERSTVFVVAPGGTAERGGIGRLVSATWREWHARQLDPPLRMVDPYGGRKSLVAALYLIHAVGNLVWHAQRGHIALVHVHMASRGSAVRKSVIVRVASRLGLPVLLHLHGSNMDEFYAAVPEWAQRFLRRTLARAQRIIVPGRYWRTFVTAVLRVDPAVVRVIFNAAAGPADLERRPPSDRCELVFVGSLTERKGLPELLQALADPRVAALPWRIRLAGEGDIAAHQARAAALGIADRVEFLGWVPETRVRALLRDSHVFVLPSHNEGISIAMLEAMAHGCAVIATPVGATLDAIADETTGLIVAVGDHTGLAAALQRVITDQGLRTRLQAAARRRWVESFQIADHCRQVQAVYYEMCPWLSGPAPTLGK